MPRADPVLKSIDVPRERWATWIAQIGAEGFRNQHPCELDDWYDREIRIRVEDTGVTHIGILREVLVTCPGIVTVRISEAREVPVNGDANAR